VEEQSSTGLTQATYVFGNYLDEALTMNRGGQTFYYHQNSLWSIYALSDSTGTGVEGYSYDAYGYQTVHLPGADGVLWTADDVILPGAKSAYGNPFLFTGQRYDPETGLLYYKYRHDSSFFGRFMQRDPLDYAAQDVNLYEYVKGRPTYATDPSGLLTCCSAWGYRSQFPGTYDEYWDCVDACYNEVKKTAVGDIVTSVGAWTSLGLNKLGLVLGCERSCKLVCTHPVAPVTRTITDQKGKVCSTFQDCPSGSIEY
jgi:RHS repeat-associated protein